MPTVTVNLVDGGAGRQCYDKNGMKAWELTRVATVSGLSAGTKQDILLDAIAQLVDVVGDIGVGTFPTRASAYITEFQPELVSESVVRVRIIYKDFLADLGTIEVGCSLSQIETNKDYSGQKILIPYTYPSNYAPDPRGVAGLAVTPTPIGRVTRLVPEACMRLRRKEYGSPLVKATQYVGSINLSWWPSGPNGLPEKRWLCTRISATSEDRIWFDVEYEFQTRPDEWDADVYYINPDDGMAAPGAVNGNGMTRVQVYPMMEFADLNL